VVRDITARKQIETDLSQFNATLEERVAARTSELAERNVELAQALKTLEQARKQLAASERRLSSVVAATGDGIWDWKISETHMYCSPRMLEIYGVPPGDNEVELIVLNAWLSPVEFDKAWSIMQQCIAGSGPYSSEVQLTCPDGRHVWVQARGAIAELDEQGAPLRMVGSITDITDRKQAEIALKEAKARTEASNAELAQALDNLRRVQGELVRSEKMASLGALVAGVAHELNTPIGNAVTVSSTLLDLHSNFSAQVATGLTRSALTAFLETIGEASQSLNRNLQRAVELVSSFKQLAADQSSDQRRAFSMQEVVHEVILAMGPSIRKSGHSVHLELDDALRLDSYPGPLGQVLMNLINNALLHAFTEHSDGNIWIRAHGSESDKVLITITDDGCGIPIELQGRIFDPFFTTRLGQGGSGLGLHIVFNLVTNLLGGKIEVQSASGAGATFAVTIPVSAPVPKPRTEIEPHL
jgi:PAS domain S-box-containing protein